MKVVTLLTLLCFCVHATGKVSQEASSMGWGKRFLTEFATPLTTNARYILGGSLVSAGMVYTNKSRRRYNKRETFDDAKPLGDYGFIGEVVGWGFLNGIYTVGQFLYGYYGESEENLRASEHMFKASFYTLLVTSSLKTVINERRPGYPEDRSSFPSGHSAMSFAFASVVAAQNGWAYGSLAYGVATYISVSRINDDWHYLHDVLIGMGIGASYGWGLKYAYDEGLPFQLAMLPMPGGGRFSFTYSY
jgi:membrane-associated phospholipid phosphatase